MIYSTTRENSRTDDLFTNRDQDHKEEFRYEVTLTVNVGMVSQFPIDLPIAVMPAIDSGVLKRMLESILYGP